MRGYGNHTILKDLFMYTQSETGVSVYKAATVSGKAHFGEGCTVLCTYPLDLGEGLWVVEDDSILCLEHAGA